MSLLETEPDKAGVEAEAQPEPSPAGPEPGSCAHCGAPLEDDQLACVECGAVVRRRRLIPSGWPLRTGLATATALMLSLLVGLGASVALQPGGQMPRTVAAAPTTPKAVVPATPTPPPATPATPAPAAKTPAPATPAPAAKTPAPAAPTTTPKTTSTPSATGNSTSTSTGTSPSTGGGTIRPTPATGQPGPFPDGTSPYSVQLLDPSDTADNPGKVTNMTDNDAATSWHSATYPGGQLGKPGIGIWFDAGSNVAYRQIALLTAKEPGLNVTIYGSADNAPPTTNPPQGWTELSPPTPVSGKTRIPLSSAIQSRYYLVWITAVPASGKATISEVSLIG